MKLMLASAALAGVVLALAASAGGVLTRGHSAAQEAVTIGVDADPTGNTATSLGPIDSCLSVSTGDTFQVDIFVSDVVDLLAWETYLVYDMSVINIDSRDVMMFQAANEDSNVFDVSEALPDIDGRYGVAAVDLADPPAPDSGSGVLARLTLKAVGAGVSPLSLSGIDINGDGTIDLGPFLTNIDAESIADLNDDGFFDGRIANAEITVGGACPSGTPLVSPTLIPTPAATPTRTPTATTAASPTVPASPTVGTPTASPTPGTPGQDGGTSSDDGLPWVVIACAVGGVAAVLLGGAALLANRRRRAR
jgi:hypothetical protein